MNISLIIRDLLLRNEQVLISGVGTLKIIHRPAQFIRTTQVLIPPAKEIVFDSQLKSGDTQLLLSIKKRNGLTESDAGEALRKFIHHLEEDIRSTGSVMLEGLGELKQDSTGGLFIEPVPELLNPGGIFALPKIEMPASEQKVITTPVTEYKRTLPLPGVRRRRKWWIPAVGLIVIVMVGSIGYFTGLITHIPGISRKKETVVVKNKDQSRIVFGTKSNAQKDTTKDTTREAISRQLDERTARENALRFENEQKQAINITPEIKPPVPAGPFQIISGSFTLTENAERHIRSMRKKGINAELLPRRGKFYMVTIGSYPTLSEAQEALGLLKEQLDQDLWVMRIGTSD